MEVREALEFLNDAIEGDTDPGGIVERRLTDAGIEIEVVAEDPDDFANRFLVRLEAL